MRQHLARWIEYFEEKAPACRPSAVLRAAPDKPTAEKQTRELAGKLAASAAERLAVEATTRAAKSLADSECCAFGPMTGGSSTNDAHQVTFWPNRGASLRRMPRRSEVSPPQ